MKNSLVPTAYVLLNSDLGSDESIIKEVKEILELAINHQFLQSRTKLTDTMLQHGLSGLDIIKQIQKEIWNLEIPDKLKVQLVDKCGEIEFRMVEGSDEFIQLESFLAYIQLNSNSP